MPLKSYFSKFVIKIYNLVKLLGHILTVAYLSPTAANYDPIIYDQEKILMLQS